MFGKRIAINKGRVKFEDTETAAVKWKSTAAFFQVIIW